MINLLGKQILVLTLMFITVALAIPIYAQDTTVQQPQAAEESTADEITTYTTDAETTKLDLENQKLLLKGNAKITLIFQDSTQTVVTSESAVIDLNTRVAEVTGNVKLLHRGNSLSCTNLTFNLTTNELVAQGDVEFQETNLSIQADELRLLRNEILEAKGAVEITHPSADVTCSQLAFNIAENRLKLVGDVVGQQGNTRKFKGQEATLILESGELVSIEGKNLQLEILLPEQEAK